MSEALCPTRDRVVIRALIGVAWRRFHHRLSAGFRRKKRSEQQRGAKRKRGPTHGKSRLGVLPLALIALTFIPSQVFQFSMAIRRLASEISPPEASADEWAVFDDGDPTLPASDAAVDADIDVVFEMLPPTPGCSPTPGATSGSRATSAILGETTRWRGPSGCAGSSRKRSTAES